MINNFPEASAAEIDEVMQRSLLAFHQYKNISSDDRALFLETIANEIESLGAALIDQAAAETNLPAARLIGERGRTTSQLRMFAAMLREGSWVEASIDTAIPDKNPPKPDLRKLLIPLGPVVVFGASNFPFAYSTAGGDTASALAVGCSVVVKAHPAHAKTSQMVFEAIQTAIAKVKTPKYVFQHLHGSSFETGKFIVQHDATAAVGFTGSFAGGKALYDYAAARKNPIPVFSEMGSINPVVLLPDTLKINAATIAKQYAASITLGMGQFCTNPGLLMAVECDGLNSFIETLSDEIEKVIPANMLHAGIHSAYYKKMHDALAQKGVALIKQASAKIEQLQALPTVATVSGEIFLQNSLLHEEVFGPYSLLVVCKNIDELIEVWKSVRGQLTTSLMGTDKDFADHHSLIQVAETIAGRIVFNNVPTGVEVCPSMMHGGPFPASTDSRFSAVGIDSVKRWVRPVCYQNCPQHLLPVELQNDNPKNIWRLLNNEWTKDKVV